MGPIDEVKAQVATRYDRLGMPSWPDPHPGLTSPDNEEYSRVSEPERYRIVKARASSWVETLIAIPEIKVETVPPAALETEGQVVGREAVRLSTSRPSALPLLLVAEKVRVKNAAGLLPLLHICVARPSVVLQMVPDCGCDACDSGSQDLLETIDETISLFISRPSVMLRGQGWYANWHPGAGSSGGDGHGPDHDRVMHMCRRLAAGEDVDLPKGTEAFVGDAWIG